MKYKYNRTITHKDYSEIPEKYNPMFNNIYFHQIKKATDILTFDDLDKKNIITANENYLVFNIEREYKKLLWVHLVFPTIFLLVFLLPYNPEDNIPFYALLFITISSIIIIGILICEYKRPKKEYIFDRKNGLITFPDFRWKENNTMPFEKVLWSSFTSRSVKGPSSLPKLTIRSPKTYFYSFTCMAYINRIEKKPLSYTEQLELYRDKLCLIIWYMDKNRPLPPGDIFEGFSKKDS